MSSSQQNVPAPTVIAETTAQGENISSGGAGAHQPANPAPPSPAADPAADPAAESPTPPPRRYGFRAFLWAFLRYKFDPSNRAQVIRFYLRRRYSEFPSRTGPSLRSDKNAAVAVFAATWYAWSVLVAIILIIVGIVISGRVDRVLGILLACLGVMPAVALRIIEGVAKCVVRTELRAALSNEQELERGMVREFMEIQRAREETMGSTGGVAGSADEQGAAVDHGTAYSEAAVGNHDVAEAPNVPRTRN